MNKKKIEEEKKQVENERKPVAEEMNECLSDEDLEGIQGGITTILPPIK